MENIDMGSSVGSCCRLREVILENAMLSSMAPKSFPKSLSIPTSKQLLAPTFVPRLPLPPLTPIHGISAYANEDSGKESKALYA
jgi:hypothetical protein